MCLPINTLTQTHKYTRVNPDNSVIAIQEESVQRKTNKTTLEGGKHVIAHYTYNKKKVKH